jgi:hypothetical protein
MWLVTTMASLVDKSTAWGSSGGRDAWRLALRASPHRGIAQAPAHKEGNGVKNVVAGMPT